LFVTAWKAMAQTRPGRAWYNPAFVPPFLSTEAGRPAQSSRLKKSGNPESGLKASEGKNAKNPKKAKDKKKANATN